MSGVPFRVRLQMYPRAEQLLLLPVVLVGWMMLALGADGSAQTVWMVVVSGLAMWVMVPDLSRYRTFGMPLRYWTTDAVIAVLLVAFLFSAVGLAASTGRWSYAGILLAALAVGVTQYTSARRALRGEHRVPSPTQQAGRSWAALVGGLPSLPGPLPWRLVYLPAMAISLVSAVLVVGGFIVLRVATGTADSGPVGVETLLPLMVVIFPAVAGVLASGLRGWTALGNPVRRWLGHAYAGSAIVSVTLIALVGLAMSTGFVGGGRTPSQMSFGQISLILAFATLCVAVIPLIATSSALLMSLIGVVPAGGTVMTFATTAPLHGPGPVISSLVVLALSVGPVVYTRRTLLGGDRPRPTGLVQGADRIYYQRQGAL
ncbi:hypothetical protein [Corynebacterium glyciniphilum]|uniref:hypothetical protein n=1 Tax=Corynebacterium glyciniphilum TaxID=1404244 RepID=UPI00264A948F|nr:hypothetical protein [Corynebacterium glyciniphilum]MDN6706190.1 hypothetical protein [Corynebacterium glyciniphilum]